MKRGDVVRILQTLYPFCHANEKHYQTLALNGPDAGNGIQYVSHWQTYAACSAEIENKIRSHGGDFEGSSAASSATSPHQLAEHYEKALKEYLPVDIRQLLEGHLHKFQYILS